MPSTIVLTAEQKSIISFYDTGDRMETIVAMVHAFPHTDDLEAAEDMSVAIRALSTMTNAEYTELCLDTGLPTDSEM